MSAAFVVLALSACADLTSQGPQVVPPVAPSSAQAVANLVRAVRFQTISDPDRPTANRAEFLAFRSFLRATYPAIFSAANSYEIGGGTLVLTWRGTAPQLDPLVLMAHQDVVPAGDGPWTRPPFAGVVDGGYVWGRGTLDLKGQLIAILEAANGLADQGFRPQRTVILVFGHDEETLGTGAQAAAARLAADGVRPWLVLDEGPPIVADFELTGGPVALVAVGERGFLTARITAFGTPGHTAVPPERTAVGDLAEALVRIGRIQLPAPLTTPPTPDTLHALAEGLGGLRGLVVSAPVVFGPLIRRQLTETPEGAAILETTITPTVVRAGERDNVVPGIATALVNVRIHPAHSVAGAMQSLQAAVASLGTISVELLPGWSEPPPVASTSGAAYRLLSDTIRTIAPADAILGPVLLAGTTDSRFFASLGGETFRFSPAIVDTAELGGIHGANERISIENFGRAIMFYRALIVGAGP